MDETAVPAVDVIENMWFVLCCCTGVLFKVLAGSFARARSFVVGARHRHQWSKFSFQLRLDSWNVTGLRGFYATRTAVSILLGVHCLRVSIQPLVLVLVRYLDFGGGR